MDAQVKTDGNSVGDLGFDPGLERKLLAGIESGLLRDLHAVLVSRRGTLVLELERGERRTLRVSSPLFDYFAPGDAVFKLDGFEWPEKWSPDEGRRVCIACGGVVELAEPMSACPRCGAPLPAHVAMQALAPRA